MYPRLSVQVEPANDDEKSILDSCGLLGSNLLRSMFGSQREYYQLTNTTNYSGYSPDSRYFRSTDNEGWRKYLVNLMGADDRKRQLQTINDAVARRILLLAKKIAPVACELTLESAAPVRIVDMEMPETMEVRIGNKIFRATKVLEDTDQTGLLESVKSELSVQAQTQLDGYLQEYATNLERMRDDYERKLGHLQSRMDTMLPALHYGKEVMKHGIMVRPYEQEYQIYIPIDLHYKYVVSSRYHVRWKLKKEYSHKYSGYLMVAIDKDYNIRWHYIYDKEFTKSPSMPLWHVNGGQLCLGTYKMQMRCITDIVRIRDDIANMLESINIDSLGTAYVAENDEENEVRQHVKEYRSNLEHWDVCPEDFDDEPSLSAIATKARSGGTWTA